MGAGARVQSHELLSRPLPSSLHTLVFTVLLSTAVSKSSPLHKEKKEENPQTKRTKANNDHLHWGLYQNKRRLQSPKDILGKASPGIKSKITNLYIKIKSPENSSQE